MNERELLAKTAVEIWREVKDVEHAVRIAQLLLKEVDRQMVEAVAGSR
jgi:hypothetical protein